MNKYLKRLILLGIIYAIFFGSVAVPAHAFKFVIANQTDEKIILYLNWWDHDLQYIGPYNLHTGEYVPKKVNILEYNYKGHLYSVDVNSEYWGFTGYIEFKYAEDNPPKTISIFWDGCRVRYEMK